MVMWCERSTASPNNTFPDVAVLALIMLIDSFEPLETLSPLSNHCLITPLHSEEISPEFLHLRR